MASPLHHQNPSLNKIAAIATLHCLSGCVIGEIVGMVIGTTLDWSNTETITLAVILAFISGYMLTMFPILRSGYPFEVAQPPSRSWKLSIIC